MDILLKTDFELFSQIKEETNLEKIPLEYLQKTLLEQKQGYTSSLSTTNFFADKDDLGFIEDLLNITERKLQIIDIELSRLEFKKTTIKSPKILAFNNDVEASLNDIRIILADINKLLFDDSTIEQWEKILNLETLETPIIVKNGIALNGLSKFFEALSIIGVFKKQWQTKLSLLNAFKHNTEFITADQFKHALNDGKSNGTAIDRHLEKIFFEFKNETDIDKNLDELLSPPPKHKF